MKAESPNAIKPVALNPLEAQLFGLGTLVQLLKRARRAESTEELGFVMVNETHALLPYRQAALWQRNAHAAGKVVAISGAAVTERNAPFSLWLNPAFANLDDETGIVETALMRESVSAQYDNQALAAARTWRYRPATVDGVPVKFKKTISITVKGRS